VTARLKIIIKNSALDSFSLIIVNKNKRVKFYICKKIKYLIYKLMQNYYFLLNNYNIINYNINIYTLS